MMSGVKMAIMALVGVLVFMMPVNARAASTHLMDCNNCHKPGVAFVKATNVCVECHMPTQGVWPMNAGGGLTTDVPVVGHFVVNDGSPAMGGYAWPTSSANGNFSSHYWGGSTTNKPSAGAVSPPATFYASRYNVSTNKTTCSMCHDPHQDKTVTPNLVRGATVSTDSDQACKVCHATWYVTSADALQTHPIVTDYSAAVAASPSKFLATVTNTASGDVKLVGTGVGCTSCHGVHYADSNSSTVDADPYPVNNLAVGDGKLLRSDGMRSVTPYNDANSLVQAQLRSNLCQSCHTYKLHGKTSDGGQQVGCLDCHSGHSYNGGFPNIYVLRRTTNTYAPINAGAYTTGLDLMAGTRVNGNYAAPYSKASNDNWSNRAVGVNGYCENCHGDVQSAPILNASATGHSVSSTEACTTCHHHDSAGWQYSFQPDVSAATCGDCHGFPPYLGIRGDRDSGGTEGGYAYSNLDGTPAPWDYLNDSGAYKNEAQTAHNTHAGGGVAFPNYYFVGTTGTENCNVCHGENAGFGAQHRDDTRASSFRDVPFNSVASAGGALTPSYSGAAPWTCNNVYCHTNGGPRDNAGAKTYQVHVTPAWDQANGGGLNSLLASGTRCSACHGNDSATMTTRANSAVHNKHLTKGYTCKVCHVDTATSNTALKAGATIGKTGGKHVNSVMDVGFDTAYSLGAANLTVAATPYVTANGTCAVYCHSNGKGVYASSSDWQVASTGACGTCHDNTTISSGSHARHVSDVNGPTLSCDVCHGTNASTGAHTGHVNGSYNDANSLIAGICNSCHAVDGAETVPVWGNPSTTDCKTCHTGSSTSTIEGRPAPAKANALSSGHGKSSGSYGTTGLTAANQDCTACHDGTTAGHFDGDSLDKRLSGTFSCEACHDGTPAVAVKTHSNTDPAYTNQKRADFTKTCLACHDPHGSSNLAMIAPTKADFGGTVVLSSFGNASPVANDNSFDESGDSPASNLDDICATCHTTTTHNNRAMAGTHNEGKVCTTCHGHNGSLGGFMPVGGNFCNDCHGNPPATGAHTKHTTVGDHTLAEDRTDCAVCHPGADSYTMSSGGNHQNSTVNLAAGISNDNCTSACHNSVSAGDGAWSDANGLNCNSCHYYSATPTSAGNVTSGASEAIGAVAHNKHFDKSVTCAACHSIENSGNPMVGPLTHINDKSGANQGAIFTGMAAALQDEAGVARALMTWTDAGNTCSNSGGGLALGCHATGSPVWDNAIPANGCTQCHTDTTTSTVNPTSSLHAATPTVTGKKHSTGFTYNAGANTADCTTCHTTSPTVTGTDHINGVFNASIGSVAAPQKITLVAGLGYTDAVTPTCSVSVTGCHSAGTAWQYKWHTNAAATNGTQCDGCHGTWTNWNTGVIAHRTGSESETVHGTGATYKCKDCHGLEAASGYPFTTTTNDWKATDGGATTLHGDGLININTAGATYARATYGGCTGCHTASDGVAAGQHAFTITSWTLNTITGDTITTSCSSCHGGATAGVSKSNYWPDGANTLGDNGTADNSGEHAVHIQKLALKVYGETATGAADNDILRDNTTLNPGLTADAKQKELCSYCHTTPGTDGDHGVTYPADVNSMYTLWNKALDNGVFTGATGTCATVDCHNNISTTSTNDWYDGATSACTMCHPTNGASDVTHTAHTAAGMGMSITCTSCHGAGTTVSTAPTAGHIDGSLVVSGSVAFTYTGGMTGTCGTNDCHYNGRYVTAARQAPKTSPYNWGTPIAGCDACHETTSLLGSGSHTAHMTTTSQAITCNSCHTAGTVATHIDGNVNFTGAAATYNTSAPEPTTDETFSTCGTNTCHNNGKNAAPYNNGLGSYTWNTAIGGLNSCTECHNNAALGELHSNHTGAATLFGINSVTCDSCHTAGAAAGTHSGHVEGTIALVAGLTYSGTPNSVNVTLNTFGTCTTTTCHSNGLGSAVVTPAWNDASSTGDDCTLCHGNAGANLTSKAHPTHIATSVQSGKAWGPYPATGSTNCGECHASPANNSSMATYTTHIDGTINFVGGNLAATSVCNTCHGGATPAITAKANWTTTPTRVTCESCHGDNTLASIGGKTAPSNAGVSFDSYGHGKVTGSGQLCLDCHDNTAAGHLDGTTGDDKRLKVVNSQNYTVSANGFCASACHVTTMNVHFANANTAGGTSDDAIYCYTCHNPHGQNGNQDAMIRNLIAGRTVSGFTSKTTRSSYESASFNSVCQACHDSAEVGHFNRATNETTHNSPTLCTDCHQHTAATAFSAAGGGCDSCHGYPPVQDPLSGAGALYPYAKAEDYPGGGRAHAVWMHLSTSITPANGWTPCAPCHNQADHDMGLGVANLQSNRDLSGNWANEATRYPRVNLDAAYDKSGTGLYNMGARNTTAGMGYCANTSCHFSESPKWDCDPASTANDPQ